MAQGMERRWVDSMAEAYERWLVPTVFRPFAVDLAGRVGETTPGRVLELAAGTGVVTREIVRAVPGAEVTATDLNQAMVEVGREQVPEATWEQADALDLPYQDGEFDAVACQFGVMFFPDKRRGFAEARRVLKPSGRALVSTWDTVDTHDFAAALAAGLERAFPDDPPTFIATVPHGYADPDLVAGDLRAAGFDGITIDRVTLEGHAPSAADVATGFCAGTPLRPQIEARADLAATIAVVAETMGERFGPGPVTGRMTAYVLEATPRT
jgi:SAM-dependent methyltransferase